MINKIKDFLKKKLNKKASNDLSDQDELLDEDSFGESIESDDATNPTINVQSQLSDEESTGEVNLPPSGDLGDEDSRYIAGKPTIKEKISASIARFKQKMAAKKKSKPTVETADTSGGKFAFLKKIKLPQISSGEGASLLSPNLSRSIESFLSRPSREAIHQVGLVLLVCSVTYTLGKVTALSLRGEPALSTAKDFTVSVKLDESFNPATLAQVKSINIFRTNKGLGGKKQVADTKCEKADQQTNLPIRLINTVVLQDEVKSLASVQVRGDRDLQEVRVGDQISNMAKIFKITRLELLIKNLESGMCELVVSDNKNVARGNPISVLSPSASREFKANKKLPGIENVGNKFSISKALLDEKMKDIGAILTQARAVKITNPDGSISFKMTEIDPGGLFPYLGVQDGDIITSINGKPIYDLNTVMGMFGNIKNLSQLSLGIKRDGSESTQEYSIKK